MKKLFFDFASFLLCCIVLLFAFSSCKKNSSATLTQQVAIENQRITKAGVVKTEEEPPYGDEDTTVKVETPGQDSSILTAIKQELADKVGRIAFSGGNGARVGVLDGGHGCSHYDILQLRNETEDNNCWTYQTGWHGSSGLTSNREVTWAFCVVDGSLFDNENFTYGVLLIDPVIPQYAAGTGTPVVKANKLVYIREDSEDGSIWHGGNNNNADDIVYPNTWHSIYDHWFGDYINPGPNIVDKNVKLFFLVYNAGTGGSGFPIFGVSYGVFGQDPSNSSYNGQIFCDDEDKDNYNLFQVFDVPTGTPLPDHSIPNVFEPSSGGGVWNGNTKYYTARVH